MNKKERKARAINAIETRWGANRRPTVRVRVYEEAKTALDGLPEKDRPAKATEAILKALGA